MADIEEVAAVDSMAAGDEVRFTGEVAAGVFKGVDFVAAPCASASNDPEGLAGGRGVDTEGIAAGVALDAACVTGSLAPAKVTVEEARDGGGAAGGTGDTEAARAGAGETAAGDIEGAAGAAFAAGVAGAAGGACGGAGKASVAVVKTVSRERLILPPGHKLLKNTHTKSAKFTELLPDTFSQAFMQN